MDGEGGRGEGGGAPGGLGGAGSGGLGGGGCETYIDASGHVGLHGLS